MVEITPLKPHPAPPRPLVPITVAFIIGIILADDKIASNSFCFWAFAVSAVCFPLLYFLKALHPVKMIIVLILGLSAGALRLDKTREVPAQHIKNLQLATASISLTGIVIEEPIIFGKSGTGPSQISGAFIVNAETVSDTDTTGLIKINFYNCNSFSITPTYGDKVVISGIIRSPRPPTNYGQFDYRRHLTRHGIYKTLAIKSAEDIRIITRKQGNPFIGFINQVREYFNGQIKKHINNPDDADVLNALILGKRTDVPDETEDVFRKTGTVHILSVSGLHIALVIGIFYWLFTLAGLRLSVRHILVIIVAILYTALTGFNMPVVRSAIMVVVFFGSELVNRKNDTMNSTALAALLLLLYNPNEIFDIGFQLSFLCVLGIIILGPEIMRFFPKGDKDLDNLIPLTFPERIIRWLKLYLFNNIAISSSAWLASMPLVIAYFHILTPVFLVSNLIVIPIVFLVLVTGLIFLAFSVIGLGSLIAPVISALLKAMFVSAELLAGLPGAYFYLPDMPLWVLLIYYATFGLYYIKSYITVRYQRLVPVLSGEILLFFLGWVIVVLIPVRFSHSDDLTLTMLDVRQGSSFFVEFPDGTNLLYDAGTSGSYDIGKGVISPFLWYKGITRIDTLVLSHSHNDHINAVPSLLERFRIKQVVISDWFTHSDTGEGILKSFYLNGIPVIKARRGDVLMETDSVKIEVLGPPATDAFAPEKKLRADGNDLSVVLRITYGDKSLLLTGD
ncbi:MAG: DNA internalization-related competence protein ComEC/Rec2, partial [Planctomycetes bacterium]|nr:DNA internalization-related competence protein ComEC/Rec2 [Planctomycetota bacterium]